MKHRNDPGPGRPGALPEYLNNALAAAPDAPLAVAFSGGPDSTALLHALAAHPAARARGLRALHVDHGLHPDSGLWSRHCLSLCATLDVPCRVIAVTVPRDGGQGLEAAARRVRYEALAQALTAGERLVTGHHREDQAETFLLRALRASGPDGLAAMRPLRPLGRGWLWRPLLDLSRDDLRAYLAAHGLSAIEDPANVDTGNDRSWLRQRLLPMLRERWPRADSALARSAALCAEASDLLGVEDARTLAQACGDRPGVLAVPALLSLPAARRARVLRRWLATLGLPPLPAAGIARIQSDLLPARPDARAGFAWSGATVRRWRDGLYAEPRRPPLPPDWSAQWNGRAPLPLPTGAWLRLVRRDDTSHDHLIEPSVSTGTSDGDSAPIATPADPAGDADAAPTAAAFDPPVLIRGRRGGERIRLPGREHHHSLKHALQDFAIPPWQRERLPLLFAAEDGELLAAGDRIVSARLDAWLATRGLALRLEGGAPQR